MVGEAGELADWNDFPHGLRVLVVDKDVAAVNQIKLILEGYHYIVSVCTKGENAIAELQDHPDSFHVALVEATKDKELDGFQVLEATRDVPSIMMTTEDDMAIMMQGIALGAVDFLKKPLTEEKLRNIWQHVVRKAFVTGFRTFKIPLHQSEVIKQYLSPSINSLNTEAQGSNADISQKHKDYLGINCCELAQDPGTPHLEQSGMVRSHEDFLDVSSMYERLTEAKRETEELKREVLGCTHESLHSQIKESSKIEFFDSFSDIGLRNTSFEDEGSDLEIDPSMFFELPDSDSDSAFNVNFDLLDSSLNQDAVNHAECFLAEELINSGQENAGRENSESSLQSPTHNSGARVPDKIGDQANSGESEKSIKTAQKKKMKVDWTPKLHNKFVQAVEQLGIDKAIPSKVMDLMGVKCLTRHNISSHLQDPFVNRKGLTSKGVHENADALKWPWKYRSNKKHLLYRVSEASNWSKCRSTSLCTWSKTRRDGSPLPSQPRSSFVPIQPRLPMVHYSAAEPTIPVPRVPLLVWGHPSNDHTPTHMWQQQHLMNAPTTWQAPDGTLWQHPATGLHTWNQAGLETKSPQLGHPVMSVPSGAAPSLRTEAITPFPVLEGSSSEYTEHLKASEMTGEVAAATQSSVYAHKQMVSAAINETLQNPAMPLPLGLRSPSMESIMSELQIQGINAVKVPA